jgi:hypothetical protein
MVFWENLLQRGDSMFLVKDLGREVGVGVVGEDGERRRSSFEVNLVPFLINGCFSRTGSFTSNFLNLFFSTDSLKMPPKNYCTTPSLLPTSAFSHISCLLYYITL